MSAEALPPLRFSKVRANFTTLHQEGRTPIFYPLPEEGGVAVIVPDQPLESGTGIHWQRDPKYRSRIIFADITGRRVSGAKSYLLSPSQAKTVEALIKG